MSYNNYPIEMNPDDQRLWATLIHVGGIFLGFWAPLIGFLVLKDRGAFLRAHAATALNFQLTMLIAGVVGGLTTFILIGFVILFAVAIAVILFPILAALAANRGQRYTYPLAIPFVN